MIDAVIAIAAYVVVLGPVIAWISRCENRNDRLWREHRAEMRRLDRASG